MRFPFVRSCGHGSLFPLPARGKSDDRSQSDAGRGRRRLGHATVSITLDTYPHAIPAMQDEAAASLVTSLPGTRLGEPEKVAQAPLAPPAGQGEGDG